MHLDFLREAYQYARDYSDDPRTQTGAILVQDDEMLLLAANRFPLGVKNLPERLERPLKFSFIEHAERNLIFQAARLGIRTYGRTIYAPWAACAECARAIVQAGIEKVICHEWLIQYSRPDWKPSIEQGLTILQEGGVEVQSIAGRVGGVKILFDGKEIEP